MPVLSNGKHEHFAQLVASGKSATEAARVAGYAEKRASITGCELLKKSSVSVRIAELRDRISDRRIEKAAYEITHAMQEAEQARVLAMEKENPRAAVAAVELKAKLNGLLIDRKEIRTGPLEDASDAHLDGIIREAAAEAEIGLGFAGEGTATKH